jgi:replicative DNA helicase
MSERVLPHSAEAERSLLGAVFLREEIVKWANVEPRQFYDPRHRAVWEAMRTLAAKDVGIDATTMETELRRAEKLEAIGGLAYLSEVVVHVPTADNVEHYIKIIRDKYVSREVMLRLADAYKLADSKEAEGDELLNRVTELIGSIEPSARPAGERIGDIVMREAIETAKLADRRARGEDVYVGVPTGYPKLDRLTGGIPFGILTVLAARPAMGKTTLAMNIADNVDAAGYDVDYFTLEDLKRSFAHRKIASGARVSGEAIRNLSLSPGEWSRAMAAANRIKAEGNWWLEEAAGMTADDIIRSARSRKRTGSKGRLMIVDYVQLLEWPPHARSENDAITYSVRKFNRYAAEGNAVILLSQLNREPEKREDHRPRQSDLRGSGELEQQGKLILMNYHEASYKDADELPPDEREAYVSKLEVIVRKNHNGENNLYAELHWDRPTYRIVNSWSDVPRSTYEQQEPPAPPPPDGDVPF